MLKPLAQALAEWTPQQRENGEPLARVAAAWPEVVGRDVARHSQPVQILRDTLVVVTQSSAWSEQLSFLSERILASLAERFGLQELRRLRFRVGKLSRRPTARVVRGTISTPARRLQRMRSVTASAQDALEHFRTAVARVQRAKSAAGWKECSRCASLVPPGASATCTPCAIAIAQERERLVARLLFEVPWLGFAGLAALVDGLGREEYEAIREHLLARWWETLSRAARTGRLSPDHRERLIASSYVIVKSGLEPEAIVPATMRNVLGDELFDLLYEFRE